MKKTILFLLCCNIIFSWELIKPENNATLNQTHVLFEWEQQSNNAFYILEVSESALFDQCVICQ